MSDPERPELSDLVEELFDVKKKWYSFGLQLKVDDARLEEFEAQAKGDFEQALRRTLQEWGKQVEPRPTWAGVVKALRTRTVNEQDLANNLESRYCPVTHQPARIVAATSATSWDTPDAPGNAPAAVNTVVMTTPDQVIDAEVQREMDVLHESFESLRMNVYSYLSSQQPDLKEFRVFVSSPPPAWKKKRQMPMTNVDLDRIMKRDTEFYEMFCVITQYTNWYNYELLKKIISRYGNPALKQQMENYCAKLSDFESHTSADLIKSVSLSVPQPNSVSLVVRLPNHQCSQFYMSDIRTLQHAITDQAGVDQAALRIHMIVQSSVEIIFLAPIGLAPYLMVSSVSPLLTSQDPLPEDVYERCVHVFHAEEAFRLMGRTMTPPSSPEPRQLALPAPPIFRRTSSSNESLDSDEPKSKFTKEDSLQSYRFLDPRHVKIFHDKVLVNGDNAVVCKAEFFHLPCVAKYVHPKLTESSSWQLENFLKGCKILESCQHPNVVAVLGMLHDENLPVPILLMELMEQSLKDFLDRAKISVPLHTQIDICCDIVQGLEYIHSKDYIHGDLTATNVLLQGNRAKICGVMSLQHNSIDAELSLCPGAPECLPRRSFSFSDYDEAIDCFSFGVLAIHIATRQIPKPPAQAVQADNISEVERYTSSLRKMRLVPKHPLHSIIIQCLNDKPNRRPSAAKLCVLISEMKTSTGYRNSFESEHLSTKLVSLQIKHMQKEVCERDKENETLRAHLESKQEEIQQKETDFHEHIQNLQGRAEGAEKELQEDRESKNRLEEEMSSRIGKLTCWNSILEEKIKAAETEIEKSKRDSKSMEHSYHAELKDVTAEKNSACKNLMKERETLGTMENKFRELEAEKALVKRQLDESDTNFAKLLQARDQ